MDQIQNLALFGQIWPKKPGPMVFLYVKNYFLLVLGFWGFSAENRTQIVKKISLIFS